MRGFGREPASRHRVIDAFTGRRRDNARRIAGIEGGDQTVVGVNRWRETEPSPLTAGEASVMTVPEQVEIEAIGRIRAWRSERDQPGYVVADDKATLERHLGEAKRDING